MKINLTGVLCKHSEVGRQCYMKVHPTTTDFTSTAMNQITSSLT